MSGLDVKSAVGWAGGLIVIGGATPAELAAATAALWNRDTRGYINRTDAVNLLPSVPSSVHRAIVVENGQLVVRGRDFSADDPLFSTGFRWGVAFRGASVKQLEDEVKRAVEVETALGLRIDAKADATKLADETAARLALDASLQLQVDSLGTGIRLVDGWDPALGAFPTARPGGGAIEQGDSWNVTGTGGVDGILFAPGDILTALVAAPGAAFSGNWTKRNGTATIADQVQTDEPGVSVMQALRERVLSFQTRNAAVEARAAGLLLEDGQTFAADGVIYRWRSGTSVIPDLPDIEPLEEATVEQFGAVGDCTGVGAGTDNSAALTRAFAWLHGGNFRRLVFPAGKRYRLAQAIIPATTPRVGCQVIMHSPITPDPVPMRAMTIQNIRDGYFELRVWRGGIDADYSAQVAAAGLPAGQSEAFCLKGCRRPSGAIHANGYLGRVLRTEMGGYYKLAFMNFILDCADNTPSLDAVPCGQGFYLHGGANATAYGGFSYANTAWTKYGSIADTVVDLSVERWEGGSTHSATEMRGVGSFWLGTLLFGDETQTQTMLRIAANAAGSKSRRGVIGVLQGVKAGAALDIDAMAGDDHGLVVGNLVTNQCLTGIVGKDAGTIKVLNHESNGDAQPARYGGAVIEVRHHMAIRAAGRSAALIEAGATGRYVLTGSARGSSRETAGNWAHVQVDSTQARVDLVDMLLSGDAKACTEIVAGGVVRCLGGRYETAEKFAGAEPTVIDNVQGVENKREFTIVMPAGQTSVIVPHGLFNTPSYVQATGQHLEVTGAVCAARDAANLTIRVPTAPTADRAIDVRAARRP